MTLMELDVEMMRRQLIINGNKNPTNDQIAMQFVRNHRTGLLINCDWMSGSDVSMSEEWKTYRQALRDLPANSKPNLDDKLNLTGVTWPTKPE